MDVIGRVKRLDCRLADAAKSPAQNGASPDLPSRLVIIIVIIVIIIIYIFEGGVGLRSGGF